MSPPTNTTTSNTSITAIDNPSTTTAFMLGQIQGELKSLNEKFTAAMLEIASLKDFRLKIIVIVSAICSAINLPGWMAMLK